MHRTILTKWTLLLALLLAVVLTGGCTAVAPAPAAEAPAAGATAAAEAPAARWRRDYRHLHGVRHL